MLKSLVPTANIIVALLCGFIIYPLFYEASIWLLISMPCLTLLAISLDSGTRSSFATGFVPVIALIWRTMDDTGDVPHQAPHPGPIYSLLGLALFFVAWLVLADRGKMWKDSVGGAVFWLFWDYVFTFAYLFVAFMNMNTFFDPSIRHLTVPIESRQRFVRSSSLGKGSSSHYHINVNPPGKAREWKLPYVYDVGLENYILLSRDTKLCIDTGNGAFGDAWYRVRISCPQER